MYGVQTHQIWNTKIVLKSVFLNIFVGKHQRRINLNSFCYEGRSKSSRKSAIIFLSCKSGELNYYSYIDKHDLYLYSKFCCSGINTMLTVVCYGNHTSRLPAYFCSFLQKSMLNDDVAFDSLPCFFHQILYEQKSICLR